ncbi:putative syndecan-2-like [Scophthalmus maximus]|uniref:Syndecan n=1 Tax=Scophthalmus maximus TaxID=52904 RepID=A0A2U9AZ67_SCOMX|nr:putative syndecan-2-like [Scophthalmus maximus]
MFRHFASSQLLVSSQSPSSTTDDLYLEGRTSGDLPIDDEDAENDGSSSGSGDYAFSDITNEEELLRRFHNFSQTTVSKEVVPFQPQPTANSPHIPPTTAAADGQVPTAAGETTPYVSPDGGNGDEEVLGTGPIFDRFTERPSPSSPNVPPSETTTAKFSIDISVTKDTDEDNSLDRWGISTPKDEGENFLGKEELGNEIRTNGQSRINDMDSPEEVTSENLWERTEVLAAVIACGVIGFLCAVSLLLLLAYRMKKKDEGSYDLGDTKLSPTAYHKAPTKEFYA